MIRATWGLTLLVVMLAMLGCHGSPSVEQGQKVRSDLLMDSSQALQLGYTLNWATDLGLRKGQQIGQVAVLGDIIIAQEPNNLVRAISFRDGAVLWRRVVADSLTKLFTPARLGDRILLATENHLLVLNAATGDVLGDHALEAVNNTAPVVFEELAIFGGVNGRIWAVDIASGYHRWANALPGRIMAAPALYGGWIFAADAVGNYGLYRALDGERRWLGRTHAQVSASPLLTSSTAFIASHDQGFYALDRADGRDRWIFRSSHPLTQAPVMLGPTALYLPIAGEGLVRIDPVKGEELWRIRGTLEPIRLSEQRLLLNTGNSLLVVDNLTGKPQLQIPAKKLKTVLNGPEDSLILVSPSGELQRLDPLGRSPVPAPATQPQTRP